MAINAIVVMCKDNPHEKRRKELEKQREGDNLTPLDPRNSILLGNGLGHDGKGYYRTASTTESFYPIEQQGSSQYPMHPMTRQEQYGAYHDRSASASTYRDRSSTYHDRSQSSGTISAQSLVHSAVPPAHHETGHHETDSHHEYDYGRQY